MEALCWQESNQNLFSLLDRLQIDYSYFEKGKVFVFNEGKIIVSNNILDCVSNEYKECSFPGNYRMFAMIYKLSLLEQIINMKTIKELLSENSEKASILSGVGKNVNFTY